MLSSHYAVRGKKKTQSNCRAIPFGLPQVCIAYILIRDMQVPHTHCFQYGRPGCSTTGTKHHKTHHLLPNSNTSAQDLFGIGISQLSSASGCPGRALVQFRPAALLVGSFSTSASHTPKAVSRLFQGTNWAKRTSQSLVGIPVLDLRCWTRFLYPGW